MASEDLQKAGAIAHEVVRRYLPDESVDVGRGRRCCEYIESTIATAITAARAETWKEAIAIVRYANAKANWPLKEGSLIKALEAAAGE